VRLASARPRCSTTSLLTNALPITVGTIILDEPVPRGVLGGLRLLAFAAVIAGAVLLARPEKPAEAAGRMTPRSVRPGDTPGAFTDSLGRRPRPPWTRARDVRTAKKESLMTDVPKRRSATVEQGVPMRELEHVTERIQRMFDEAFGGMVWPARLAEPPAWSPPVDVEETDDAYVIEAELSSVKPEDLNIDVVGDDLQITGEIKQRERKGTLRRQTPRTGRFAYRVTLPSHADAEKIDARLADGVLTVRVPKTQRDQRRRIEISAA
jgi:HSP20 family protein